MSSATATPTASRPQSRVTREYAEQFLSSINGWIYQLAHQHHERMGMTVEDLAHEIRTDIFLHLPKYDPARSKPTTWVTWRCRYVLSLLTRKMGRIRSAVPFSQMADAFEGHAGEVLAVDDREPDAELLAADDADELEQLRAGVRLALGFLPPAREDDLKTYYGIGEGADQEPATLREVAARRGVTKTRVGQTVQSGLAALAKDARLQELASRHGFTELVDVPG